jgi:hypothetical protein
MNVRIWWKKENDVKALLIGLLLLVGACSGTDSNCHSYNDAHGTLNCCDYYDDDGHYMSTTCSGTGAYSKEFGDGGMILFPVKDK